MTASSPRRRVPLLEKACAEAFASSVESKSAIAAEKASLVPVMVTWTTSVSVSLLLSVMVTV